MSDWRKDKQLRERIPMLDAVGAQMLKRMNEHPDAPVWNYAVGDRLIPEDLPAIDYFRQRLAETRREEQRGAPPPRIINIIAGLREKVEWFTRNIPADIDLERKWGAIPFSCRSDLARAPWQFVPDDLDLDRLVIYRTAGTTGHPIEVPHHPRAIGCYLPLIEYALAKHGVKLTVGPDRASCFLISHQIKTYTYHTVLYGWQGTGFAKVNLRETEWRNEDSAKRYFADFSPELINGEPVAFSEMIRLGIAAEPRAMVSTSVALNPRLKKKLETAFSCPVIDWYSMVETGPIAYSCPLGNGYHIISHDLHVETIRPDGSLADAGERGEITVTGGRNPYLPLLRYRTGDWGRIEYGRCSCGDNTPRLHDIEGRTPVVYRSSDSTPVGTVDISRLLREFPLLQHVFNQNADLSCELQVRPLPDQPPLDLEQIRAALGGLFGGLPIEIRLNNKLGDDQDGKLSPYRSALKIEE